MRPGVVLVAAAGVVVVVCGVVVFSPSGLSKLDRLREEERALAADVAQQKAENARIAGEIQLLRGDTEASRLSLEKRAREELGFTGPGEVVLHVPLPPTATDGPEERR